MNKNVKSDKTLEKLKMFQYEFKKIKKNRWPLLLITVALQFISFSFFCIVAKFDKSDDIIATFNGVLALSTTISVCGIAIFSSIILRKDLVRFYIGEHRNRIFLFPVDRKELFQKKTNAALAIILLSFGSASLIFIGGIILMNYILKLESSGIINEILVGIITIIVSCLVLYIILVLSEMLAIWKQSEITMIVSTVVLMLLFSNILAIGLMSFPIVTIIFLSLLASAVRVGFKFFSKKIRNMEVL